MNQVIPEAAVEAAARELWDVDQHDDVWVDDFATYDDFLRHKARMVLEAAAPHMLAGAWDEGVLEADGRMETPYGIDYYTNPYRTQQ